MLEPVAQALSFLGLALLVGVPSLAALQRRAGAAGHEEREEALIGIGAALVVAGAVMLLLAQGGRAPARLNALVTARGLTGVVVLAAAAGLPAGRVRTVALVAGLAGALLALIPQEG